MGAALAYAPFATAQATADPKAKQATDQMKKIDADKDSQVSKEEYMKYQEKKFDAADKDKHQGPRASRNGSAISWKVAAKAAASSDPTGAHFPFHDLARTYPNTSALSYYNMECP